ncbi:MAG: phosphatidylglycerophosphatase A [Balneolaceae bacterium]
MDRVKLFIGTGFGIGLAPLAPGTFGSLVIIILLYFLVSYNLQVLLPAFVILFSALTLWVSSWFEIRYGKDPAKLVMDEWAGQFLTFISISFTGTFNTDIIILITGFVLFRLFDIWKPLGIRKLQNLSSGWGVLADDLLAGLYALVCLKTLIFVWSKFFGMI